MPGGCQREDRCASNPVKDPGTLAELQRIRYGFLITETR